jgi:hypothetical protein
MIASHLLSFAGLPVLGLMSMEWTSRLIPLLGASLPRGSLSALSRKLRAGFQRVFSVTLPRMGGLFRKRFLSKGEHFRQRLLSKITPPPGADDSSVTPKLPSGLPPASVNLLTFLPRVGGGKANGTVPPAAS